jgi:hypothetical protein
MFGMARIEGNSWERDGKFSNKHLDVNNKYEWQELNVMSMEATDTMEDIKGFLPKWITDSKMIGIMAAIDGNNGYSTQDSCSKTITTFLIKNDRTALQIIIAKKKYEVGEFSNIHEVEYDPFIKIEPSEISARNQIIKIADIKSNDITSLIEDNKASVQYLKSVISVLEDNIKELQNNYNKGLEVV